MQICLPAIPSEFSSSQKDTHATIFTMTTLDKLESWHQDEYETNAVTESCVSGYKPHLQTTSFEHDVNKLSANFKFMQNYYNTFLPPSWVVTY